MSNIKKTLKLVFGKYNLRHISYSRKIMNINDKEKKSFINCFFKTKIIKLEENKGKQIRSLFEKIDIGNVEKGSNFYYFIDVYKNLYNTNSVIANFAIDYQRILEKSLKEYEEKILSCKNDDSFFKNEYETIKAIELLIDRTIQELKNKCVDISIIQNIENIKEKNTNTFEEALQRILFINQILWQTGHFLNGLGRLDLILYKFYADDLRKGIITKEKGKLLLKEFLMHIHKFYKFKSNSLIGDTGQVIILGGLNVEGIYQYNDLTYMFIEIIKELNIPDPKLLLRVSKSMPRDLLVKAVECIQTGIGCPLLANDDVIISRLIDFGIRHEDACNYGTSACWEPIIIGKSISQNNIQTINYIKPLESVLDTENLEEINSLEKLNSIYKKYLKEYLVQIVSELNLIKFEEDPILSLFVDDSFNRKKDVSDGGAIYNNFGILTVAMANTINSILNIEKYVFEEKKFTLLELNRMRNENFKDNEDVLKMLKGNKEKYGVDNDKIINLTNELFTYTSEILNEIPKTFNGNIKIGLSSPAYIDQGKLSQASLDGRKVGEPLSVHISSENSNAYTELIQFASKLDYNDNRFNGNVIDFFIAPNFIQDNFEKIVDFLLLSIKTGFFEMQLNVVSSETLIKAKKEPEKFPNLIVRVWGFSAYFNDLPEEYKDYLIERALKNEGNSY